MNSHAIIFSFYCIRIINNIISVIVVIITSPKSGFTTSTYALTSKDISDNNESFTKPPSSISILGSIDFTYPKLLSFLS